MFWTDALKGAGWSMNLAMAAPAVHDEPDNRTRQPDPAVLEAPDNRARQPDRDEGGAQQPTLVRQNMLVHVQGSDPPPPWVTGVQRARPSAGATHPQVFRGMRVCGLELCMRHGKNATRLFVDLPSDGCGSRILRILQGMAVAAKARMNFGGAVGKQRSYPNGNDFHGVLDDFFGGGAAAELLREEINADNQTVWQAVFDRKESAYQYANLFGDAVYMFGAEVMYTSGHFDVTPGFLASVRKPFEARATAFAAGRPAVAMHVRRGDLPLGYVRIASSEYFYDTAGMIREHLPDADIHVFSSTLKDHMPRRGVWERKVMYNESDFDGFRQRGMTVHLDESDLLVPWTHFMRANVFVSSHSAYSDVAMLLSRGCVVAGGWRTNYPYLVDPRRSINLRSALARNRRLRACLQHAGLQSRWAEAAPGPPP